LAIEIPYAEIYDAKIPFVQPNLSVGIFQFRNSKADIVFFLSFCIVAEILS
jgi:hypothetical protein